MTLVKRYRASFCTILAALFFAVTNCTAMPQTQAAAEPPAEEPAAAVVEERAEERSDEVQGLNARCRQNTSIWSGRRTI